MVKTQASTAGGAGSIPGWRTKRSHMLHHVAKKKKRVESPHSDAQEDIEVRTGINKEAQNLQLSPKSFQKVKENKNRIYSEEKLHRQCIGRPVT